MRGAPEDLTMGIRSFLGWAFSSALKGATIAGAKAITGPVRDISGTAKDVTGIRKDLVETKLAQYKAEEYESLIQKATLDDVKKYDPKTQRLVQSVRKNEGPNLGAGPSAPLWSSFRAGLAALVFALGVLAYHFGGPTVRVILRWAGIGLGGVLGLAVVALLLLWYSGRR
jgi:hypothetical protein